MDLTRLESLRDGYRDELLGNVLPFWWPRAVDVRHGGFFTAFDADGSLVDTDKAIWAQGRFSWLLGTLARDLSDEECARTPFECSPEALRMDWLDAAEGALSFVAEHATDHDGRLFFLVTEDGRPLRKRRYGFSEAFAAIGHAAVARAGRHPDRHAAQAEAYFDAFAHRVSTPGLIEPKVDSVTRPMRSIGAPMITIDVAHQLRELRNDEKYDVAIDRAIEEIERYFVKPELAVVLETVGVHGEVLDHFDGRLLNPGHAIEAAWFILREARHRGGDERLTTLGVTMLDFMWERGWDSEYGGIFYFRDLHGRPVQEYWHDMKFWWPHNETILATLLASLLTGDDRHAARHRQVHDWAYQHFPEPEHGEWFGYLHRDGRRSSTLKGNHWKGPFHLPRMLWCGWRWIDDALDSGRQR